MSEDSPNPLPARARELWQTLLADAMREPNKSFIRLILDSVVIDMITNEMAQNDEFAISLGRRIETLMNAWRGVDQ